MCPLIMAAPDNQQGLEETQTYGSMPESAQEKADTIADSQPAEIPPAQVDPPAAEVAEPSVPGTPQSVTQSVATEGGTKPVEQFTWVDLKKPAKEYCANCKRPVDAAPSRVVRKKGHGGVSCRACHNVTSMLYKKMDMKSLDGWKDFSPEQMAEFFVKAGQCSDPSGNLQWAKLKGCLVDSMCEHERHIRETSVKGKFLPLSVYAKKGFDCSAIESRAEKRESDLPLALIVVTCIVVFVLHVCGVELVCEQCCKNCDLDSATSAKSPFWRLASHTWRKTFAHEFFKQRGRSPRVAGFAFLHGFIFWVFEKQRLAIYITIYVCVNLRVLVNCLLLGCWF